MFRMNAIDSTINFFKHPLERDFFEYGYKTKKRFSKYDRKAYAANSGLGIPVLLQTYTFLKLELILVKS